MQNLNGLFPLSRNHFQLQHINKALVPDAQFHSPNTLSCRTLPVRNNDLTLLGGA
ncbi:hypothetical protein SAMN06295888_115119 [Desulfonatronum zhilinae]|nr:hypothetical protein SAMN06295888_115119 [Desulfonatronum zhilinae]